MGVLLEEIQAETLETTQKSHTQSNRDGYNDENRVRKFESEILRCNMVIQNRKWVKRTFDSTRKEGRRRNTHDWGHWEATGANRGTANKGAMAMPTTSAKIASVHPQVRRSVCISDIQGQIVGLRIEQEESEPGTVEMSKKDAPRRSFFFLGSVDGTLVRSAFCGVVFARES